MNNKKINFWRASGLYSKLISKIFLQFVFLLCGCSLFAQDSTLNLADKFFDAGFYQESITEYKRFVFFNPVSEKMSYAYYKIALAYRNEQKWAGSVSALQQSIRATHSDSLKNEREITLAVISIANQNYKYAEFTLIKVEKFSKYPNLKRKAAFFRGVSALYSFKWNEAKTAFQVYFKNQPSNVSAKLDSIFLEADNIHYKSPTLAKWLSTFLPGTGQIYAGDWRDGVNASALNAVTAYPLFNNLIEGRYQDAVFTFFLIFQRYYVGNRENAQISTEDYNKRLNQKFAKQILNILMQDENQSINI